MKERYRLDVLLLLFCFVASRVTIKLVGVTFGYNALFEYWQYLDVGSLKTNLLQSLWYQHSQPPVFNLLLGIILKVSGNYNLYVIKFLFLATSFCNATLLLSILSRILRDSKIPLIFSLLYLLSPATMLFENELFYTTFISLLLLLAVNFMFMPGLKQSWRHLAGMFAALSLVCLTRSMYHLMWLLITTVIIIYYYRKNSVRKVLLMAFLSIILAGGLYVKNAIVFGNFSASSWVGMNFSRIVFHNKQLTGSNSIASLPPFMPVSYYKKFLLDDNKKKYAGKNDRNLLMETKNDRYINMNNVGYLEISKIYLAAGLEEVSRHPASYLKNACTAFIIFFTPASTYFKVTENEKRIRYYDMIYSFNPAPLFTGRDAKKLSLAIAAIPKFIFYVFIFFVMIREGFRSRSISLLNVFIIFTILFSAIVSSLLDYGENMRFRYEIEPLFLILAAQAIVLFKSGKRNIAVSDAYGKGVIVV